VGKNGQRLSREAAAKRLEEMSPQLRTRAGVVGARHGAHRYIFDLLLTSLAENLRRNGDAEVSLTYDEWTLLANGRGSGKSTSRGNVLRFFNGWKDDFRQSAIASDIEFQVFTPEGRGSKSSPGRAGARLKIAGGIEPADSPAAELSIDKLLRQRRQEETIRAGLQDIHSEYLTAAEAAGATKPLIARLRQQFARIDANVARTIARAVAIVVVILFLGGIGAERAIAKYRRDLAELRQKALQWMGFSMDPRCQNGQPVVLLTLSFSQEDAAPPFILLRNDTEIARFTERTADNNYSYIDKTVEAGKTYAYRVAREMYLTHERAYSRPWQVTVPRCRGQNHPPSVSNIRIAPNPARVGEPVRISVVATDAEADPLDYTWRIGHEYSQDNAPVQTRSFAKPGFVDVSLGVQDGHDDYVSRVARIGVTDGKARNSPPRASLLAAPDLARPGEWVTLIAVADDPDGDTLQFTWDPGGPQSGSGDGTRESAQYLYPEAGSMHPRVTVSDSSLAEVVATATLDISADAPPETAKCAGIDITPAWPAGEHPYGVGPVGTTFHFMPRFDGGTPTSVSWTFGDGSPLSHALPTASIAHRYGRAGIFWTYAVATFGQRKSACSVMVSVGTVPYTPEPEFGIRGTVVPAQGTTGTLFRFQAQPGRQLLGRRYRWTFTNRFTNEQIVSAWGSEPSYAKQFPSDGAWAIECEVQEPSGSRMVLRIGDAFVHAQR